jgi:class 3 adenylate cyclase/tetratricopeptide (TPR) repeat protein
MTCTACGADVRAGAKFCSECGAATAQVCPGCGSSVGASDKFCAECGTQLGEGVPRPAPTASTRPSPPSGEPQERRFVTALFIDLVGFTPLTESRDSEEVRGMLTRYFDRAREIVDRFGGVIDKYIGDAVMAVWGAKVSHEDDAERAVRAALELVDAVQELGRVEGMDELRARAGVLSGEAAVGGDGNATTGLIIGDTVNTASRLQSAALPGTVLVGRATRELAGRAIEFEPGGALELKGKSEPVETWRALRVVGGAGGSRRADGLVPPFVGRGDELRLLKDNVHAVERDRRIRLVSIVGQGGIGKSRLIDEFWNYLDGLTQTTYWHHGRSPAYGDGLAFWALGEMVRQRAGITEGDDEHRTRTRLRTMLAEYVPDADDRAWMEPRLEGLLGVKDAPAGDRAELFAAWRMLFHRLAERSPVVMAFEDLHWADDGVLDFIEEMISLGTEVPILLVSLARPELLDRRPGWGSGRTNTTSVHLAPLAASTMAELVTGVVADAPGPLIDRLVERSAGVPLYAVELLRMLAARELIVPTGEGHYAMAGDVSNLEIPDSLHGLVGSRIDQFEAAQRALIADAAIVGQSFTIEGLAALRGQTVVQLAEELEPLVRREILSVNRDPRSPERGQYRFVQSIIREVAHQRISRAERLERHLRVAEYFESLDDPELAGVAASHYLDALEAAPSGAEAGAVSSRAVASLLAAADRADMLQSHAQVVRLCRRGIDLTDDAAQRGELLIRAARAAHAGLDVDAERLAREALEAFAEVGDGPGRVRAAAVLAKHLDDIGRSNEAWPPLLEALEGSPGETAEHAAAMAELARAYMLDRQDEVGADWCDRALAVAEPLDLVPTIAEAWTTKGAALSNSYRIREATVLLEAALELARDHQLTGTKRRVMQNLSFVSSGDNPLTDPRFDLERLDDARRLGNPRLLAEALIAYAGVQFNLLDTAGCDATLSEIDPSSLSQELRLEFEDLGSYRRMMAGHAAEEVEVRRRRRSQRGTGDSQTVLGDAVSEGIDLYLLGEFRAAFDTFIGIGHHSPGGPDLSWSLVSALPLDDPERFSAILEKSRERPFRGRNVDLVRRAAEGAAAALDGRVSDAAQLFEQACDLCDQVWGPLYGSMIKVGAARLLGLDHPLGRRYAREAYDAWVPPGLTTLVDLHSEHLLAPSEGEAQEETA